MAADQPGKHLFTPETASAAGRKSAEARRQKAATVAALPTELAQKLAEVRGSFADVPLAESIHAVLGVVLARLAAGEIPVRHAGDAAELVKALHDIAQLEAGRPTSIAASVSVSGADAVARLQRLQATARQVVAQLPTSSAVPAVADVVTPDAVIPPHDDEEHQAVTHPEVVEVAAAAGDPDPDAELEPHPEGAPVCRPHRP